MGAVTIVVINYIITVTIIHISLTMVRTDYTINFDYS